MLNEMNCKEYAKLFREKLASAVEITPKRLAELLQGYDELLALFYNQEARHKHEMHEAVVCILRKKPIPRIISKTYVYLIATQDKTKVKIGLSTNPERRLSTLATGNSEALCLLYAVVGGRSLERSLHSKFRQHCIRNEWYTHCSEIEAVFVELSGVKEEIDVNSSQEKEV